MTKTITSSQQRRRLKALWANRPRNKAQLRAFTQAVLGLDVPAAAEQAGSSPLDYLAHAFFDRGQDVVVWAPRGGGKTMLGAAATVLDLLFKPGVEVRLLGGSLEQSQRMYEYVLTLLDRPLLRGLLRGEPTQRRVVTRSGARAAVLSQSQRSVRGLRVQKLRCDEVDLFDLEVWEAAQFVTRGAECGGQFVSGVIEALSTMHVPCGLMSQLAGQAQSVDSETDSVGPVHWAKGGSLKNGSPRNRLIRWTALDVIARCEPQRPCEGCVLWGDCGGRAKQATGFVSVDDLVRQWQRSSRVTWDSEMMCRQPAARERVYEEFDPQKHVREQVSLPGTTANPTAADADDPNTAPAGANGLGIKLIPSSLLVGGMDFGWRNPTVFLWARVGGSQADDDHLIVHVIDEYAQQRTRLEDHLSAITARSHGELAWIGIDPAGGAGNGQTGLSDATVLRRHGQRVRARQSALQEGIELVRRLFDHGQLFIHPRCRGLIDALRTYHYDVRRPRREEPVKDGPDHFCDALRYLLMNLTRGGSVRRRDYLYGS